MGKPQNKIIKNIGVNTADGLGHILPVAFTTDHGNSHRIIYPVTLDLTVTKVKFSWLSPKTGNVIYREPEGN